MSNQLPGTGAAGRVHSENLTFKRKASLLSLFLQKWAPTYLPSLSPSSLTLPAHTHVLLSCSSRSTWPDYQALSACLRHSLHAASSQRPSLTFSPKITETLWAYTAPPTAERCLSFVFRSGPCVWTIGSTTRSPSYSPWGPHHSLHPSTCTGTQGLAHQTNSASLSACTKEYEHLRNATTNSSAPLTIPGQTDSVNDFFLKLKTALQPFQLIL